MMFVNRLASARRLCVAAVVAIACFSAHSASVQTPDDVAYADVGGERMYYTSLDTLFSEVTNDTSVVVLKDRVELSSSVSVTNNITLSAEVPSLAVLSKDVRFEILENASLTISNLFLTCSKAGSAPFVVSGGALTFAGGAKFSDFYMIDSGRVVRVDSGVFTMLGNSSIENCEALSSCWGAGGAVYLAGPGCRFEFFGGTISKCVSPTYGGAAYAAKGSRILLKGSPKTEGNSAKVDEAMADLYLAKSDDEPLLSIDGDFSGKVGVCYSGRGSVSNVFALVSAGVSQASDYSKIVNTADTSLAATLSDDGSSLVWTGEEVDDAVKPLPDEQGAAAAVVSETGKLYYEKVEDALTVAADGERVELCADASLSSTVEISGEIAIDGAGHTLSRAGNFFIDVGSSSLSVTNIVLDGMNLSGRFLDVDGGTLVFEDGVTLRNARGGDAGFVAPVVVSGGRFVMNGGRIENCVNSYIPPPGGALTAGAVAVSGGEAHFNGGLVTRCVGSRAGGVCAYNMSTVYVKDGFTVLTNATPAGAVSNLVIQDLSKMIVLDDVTGKIGCYDGYMADTNIAAHVDASFASSASPSNLVASALRFRHDVLDVKAVPVTNGVETLFVWRTALGNDGKFTTTMDGVEKVYGQIEFPLEDPDFVPCPPFAFTAIGETDNKADWVLTIKPAREYCKYLLYTSDDLKNWELVHETGALAPGTVTADGEYVFESPAAGDRRFWRAEGKDGLK